MKKVFYLLLVAGTIVSCLDGRKKVTESSEYQRLQSERDSLMNVLQSSENELEEMMVAISEVEANFDKIREAEKYISTQSAQSGELSQNTKDRITDNFQMIQEILKRNKEQLANLNQKYASSNKQVASMQNTIDRLNKEMQESSDRLAQLQAELAQRDETISRLLGDISNLAQRSEQQSNHSRARQIVAHSLLRFWNTIGAQRAKNSYRRIPAVHQSDERYFQQRLFPGNRYPKRYGDTALRPESQVVVESPRRNLSIGEKCQRKPCFPNYRYAALLEPYQIFDHRSTLMK